MEKVFLSHSSHNKDFVRLIADKFGKDRCVYDEMCFEVGMKNLDEIFRGLDQASIFVLFISDESLESEWVKKEIKGAAKRLNQSASKLSQIFPVIIDEKIDHTDPRIPDFLKKGFGSYNLGRVTHPEVAYRKIEAQLVKRKLENNLQYANSYGFFYGRNNEISAFKNRYDETGKIKVLVATGIPGIGRRSYLIQALRDAQILERYYDPPIISLDKKDGIEDILAKLYEIGFGKFSLKDILELPNMEMKVDALISAFQDIQNFKEHLIIYDDECLVTFNGELRGWFEEAISAAEIRPEITISIASRRTLGYVYEQNNPDFFSIELSTLPYPEWNGLLRTYSKKIGIEMNASDREYFKNVITGYPPQVIYCADLAKEKGISYVKDNTYQLVSNIAGKATLVLDTAISKEEAKQGYGILSFISTYGVVPVNILQKIFKINPLYEELFNRFLSLTICRLIGSAREYAEINPVIGDYIQRNRFDLPEEIKELLKTEMERFCEIIERNPDLAYDMDFESLRFQLKENIKEKKKIPTYFMYSTIYLQSIFELYNAQKYHQVIEIVKTLKTNGAFNSYEEYIQFRIQGYYCRALAREKNKAFYTEVEFFRPSCYQKQQKIEYNFLCGFMDRNCGNFPAARASYLAVLKQYPDHRATKRELVATYIGLEDYESAYTYAKDNYEHEPENLYNIQSYFEILIHMSDTTIQEHLTEINEMIETLYRINKNKPSDFYYQINALYATYIEFDQQKAYAFLEEGLNEYSWSSYLAKTKFDCCERFNDIQGMENALNILKKFRDNGYTISNVYEVRKIILDAYHRIPREVILANVDHIKGISENARMRLKIKISDIVEMTRKITD